jgi:hypothetical protein
MKLYNRKGSEIMDRKTLGLILFVFGAAFTVVFAYGIAGWGFTQFYRFTPLEEVNQTPLALGGPLYFLWLTSVPLGASISAIGMILYTQEESLQSRVLAFVILGVIVILSIALGTTSAYYPVAFGIAGGILTLLFVAYLWYWGKLRANLDGGPAQLAADFRAISAILIITTAASLVGPILGGPFLGLYFPERVIANNILPYAYATGLKIAYMFVFFLFFLFLANYVEAKAAK